MKKYVIDIKDDKLTGESLDKLGELLEKALTEFIKLEVVSKEPEGLDIPYLVNHLAGRINWNPNNLLKYLETLEAIYPAAVYSIFLREVAIIMDEKYPDHISNSKEIWTIRMTDGKIMRYEGRIKSFKNFAAFRTLEDAIIAKKVTGELLPELFKGGKQED